MRVRTRLGNAASRNISCYCWQRAEGVTSTSLARTLRSCWLSLDCTARRCCSWPFVSGLEPFIERHLRIARTHARIYIPTRRHTLAHTRKSALAHTHACTHTQKRACSHPDTTAHTHTRTHARTHARTHTHTHARTLTRFARSTGHEELDSGQQAVIRGLLATGRRQLAGRVRHYASTLEIRATRRVFRGPGDRQAPICRQESEGGIRKPIRR